MFLAETDHETEELDCDPKLSNLVGQFCDGWMVQLTSYEWGICLYNNRMLSAIRDNSSLLAERLNLPMGIELKMVWSD